MSIWQSLILAVLAAAVLGLAVAVLLVLRRTRAITGPSTGNSTDASAGATGAATGATTGATVGPSASRPAADATDPAQARAEARALRREAAEDAERARHERERAEATLARRAEEVEARRQEVEVRERRLAERERRHDLEVRHLEERSAELTEREASLATRREELGELEAQRRLVLERTAGLSAEQARAELVAAVERQAKRDAVGVVRDIERAALREGETRAREIVVGAIQRLASEQTAESVVSVLHLPGDEMKGRIIGREGRNIRAFEQVTGVNLIIDDTPEAVLLSCFDPVRREIGRLTLEALVLDGRIHPHRIEEQYERSRLEVDQLCQRAAEDAMAEVGVTDLHPELVSLLGRLRYRTSYGQNVLRHLVESAHLAGLMAAELGLDRELCIRCALLHDIGKALTHEAEGSHAIVGAEQARRYGEHEDVVHAIEAHHNEVEPRTVEAVLTQAADAISGGRPGARRESLESYVARLERLEEIARSHDGVEKVFAMQAGREVRVMVKPEAVDDIQAQVLARDIAKQVEEELTYPGQIRVTVVRESRASEIAR